MFGCMKRISPRRQGDLGELSAMDWLESHGYWLYLPFGHSPDVDIVATRGEDDETPIRVQVKTATHFRDGRWDVKLSTTGGNQSWNGIIKRFNASRCDRLFVHVADGRRWFMPAELVDGGCGIRLGGPKYAEYEGEPGAHLVVHN